MSLRFQEPGASAVAAYLDHAVHLIVCGPVVAEMLPREPNVETWLGEYGVEVDWNLGRAVWRRVGQAHAEYTHRRRKSGGGVPRGILTDYLIGAHAETNGLPLLTLNEHDYFSFQNLEVLTP